MCAQAFGLPTNSAEEAKFLPAVAILCLFAVSCAPAPAPPEEPPDTTAEDRATIDGTIEPFEAAYNAADVDGVLAFYDEQIVRMPQDAPSTEGLGGVRLSLEEAFALGTPDISITQEELILSGDIAISRGNYLLTFTPEDGEPVVVNGKYLNVLRRQVDGDWKIARSMISSNVPPAE